MVALLGGYIVVVDLALYKTAFSPLVLVIVMAAGYGVWRVIQSGGNK